MATPLTTALEIDLTWTDNASNETGFIVERSPDGSTNWTQVGTPAANATSFNDTTAGLTMGTAYYYRVRAVNTALGQSGNSNVASAMISAVPAAPSNLAATSSTTAIEIDLTWTDNANDETGFVIERSPNGTDTWTQVRHRACQCDGIQRHHRQPRRRHRILLSGPRGKRNTGGIG